MYLKFGSFRETVKCFHLHGKENIIMSCSLGSIAMIYVIITPSSCFRVSGEPLSNVGLWRPGKPYLTIRIPFDVSPQTFYYVWRTMHRERTDSYIPSASDYRLLQAFEIEPEVIAVIKATTTAPNRGMFKLLFDCYGLVYGSYLRDVVAAALSNSASRGIDIVLSAPYRMTFNLGMWALGYTAAERGNIIYTRHGAATVKAHFVRSEPDMRLSPALYPDYDVNTLAYDGVWLHLWYDGAKETIFYTPDVLAHIHERKAVQLRVDAKNIEEGYTVIGSELEVYSYM